MIFHVFPYAFHSVSHVCPYVFIFAWCFHLHFACSITNIFRNVWNHQLDMLSRGFHLFQSTTVIHGVFHVFHHIKLI